MGVHSLCQLSVVSIIFHHLYPCCLQVGEAAPPLNRPAFLKAFYACRNKEASCYTMFAMRDGYTDHVACTWGRAAPPPTPLLSCKPSAIAVTKQCHVITMFAVRDGYTDHCVCNWAGADHPPPCMFLKVVHA